MAECNDSRCPVHGGLSVRGDVFEGVVVSAKPTKTVVVERTIVRFIPKYERYRKQRSKLYVHNPACINAKENDIVRVGETRKLSKTKCFVVLAVLGTKKVVKAEEGAAAMKEKEEKASKQAEKEKQPQAHAEHKEHAEQKAHREKNEAAE